MVSPSPERKVGNWRSTVAYLGPVHRWETYWTDLDPVVGSEQGGDRRPVLVVSNDGFNSRVSIVTIVPMTKRAGKQRKVYPFEVVIPPGLAGNPEESIVMPYQVRTVDRKRLLERMGALTDSTVRTAVEDCLLQHLGIDLDEPERGA